MTYHRNENLYSLLKENPDRVYVVAEAGLNHGGNKERALALLRAAKWAGADAVKFQIFGADRLSSTLPLDAAGALYKEARRLGIEVLSTPFDKDSADFLDDLGVGAFKIAPADITNRTLIEHVSKKGKPVLLSTGMSTGEQIENAIDWMHTQLNDQVVLLHCVSSYPAELAELNLKSVQYLRDWFGEPVGFSDHSVGTLASVVATSVGAQVIERYFKIESRGDTPDQAVSMDARALKNHIEELRTIAAVLGERRKVPSGAETYTRTSSRQALLAPPPIVPDEAVNPDMLYAFHPAAAAAAAGGARVQ